MESFYGGLRGTSFNLVKSYTSKQEMLIDFLSASCAVGYGEYAIINSTDDENGNIYKRTNNLTVDNGAVYITNISGTMGESASLNFVTGFNTMSGDITNLNISDGLVPGYYQENSQDFFNDSISFKTLKTKVGNNTETKIAFQFPYPVIDIQSQINTNLTQARITRTDNRTHPYYYSYLLELPQTIEQNRINKLEVKTITSDDILYDNPDDKNDITSNYLNKTVIIYSLEEKKNNILIIKEYLLCEYNFIQDITYNSLTDKIIISYNNHSQEIPLKQINQINLTDEGFLQVSYANDNNNPHVINENNPLKWIEDISYNNITSRINFTYNTGDIVGFNFSLSEFTDCVTRIEIDGTGDNLLVYTSDSVTPEQINLHPLKQISDIVVRNDGNIVYTYTDGTNHYSSDDDILIKWITNIEFDEENNQFVVTYNTKKANSNENESETYEWQLKTIVSAERDGTDLIINYNTGSPTRIQNVFIADSFSNFKFTPSTGKLTIDIGNETKDLGTISYVNEISYNSDTNYLQYSFQNNINKENIVQLKMLESIAINNDNQLIAQYNTENSPTIIGEVSSNHILDIELIAETSGISNVLAYLRDTYPNGYQNNPNYCIAAGPANNRTLYAYGYYSEVEDGVTTISENRNWYILGDFSKTIPVAIASSSSNSAVQALPEGGIWFVTEDE